jgi:hypothetical protein
MDRKSCPVLSESTLKTNGRSGPYPDGQAPEIRHSAPRSGSDPDLPVANGRSPESELVHHLCC